MEDQTQPIKEVISSMERVTIYKFWGAYGVLLALLALLLVVSWYYGPIMS